MRVHEDSSTELTQQSLKKCIFRGAHKTFLELPLNIQYHLIHLFTGTNHLRVGLEVTLCGDQAN
jgi:hypothetical protein